MDGLAIEWVEWVERRWSEWNLCLGTRDRRRTSNGSVRSTFDNVLSTSECLRRSRRSVLSVGGATDGTLSTSSRTKGQRNEEGEGERETNLAEKEFGR